MDVHIRLVVATGLHVLSDLASLDRKSWDKAGEKIAGLFLFFTPSWRGKTLLLIIAIMFKGFGAFWGFWKNLNPKLSKAQDVVVET